VRQKGALQKPSTKEEVESCQEEGRERNNSLMGLLTRASWIKFAIIQR
jgi:hypothetical protein